MTLTNTTSTSKVLFYKVNGQVKRVIFAGQQSITLPDLISTSQIIYNTFDLKVKHINETVNRRLIPHLSSISNVANNSLAPIGNIFTNNGTSISDFNNVGGAYSTDGTKITSVKGGGGLFQSYLSYEKDGYATNLEIWNQSVTYNVLAQDGFGQGMGFLYCTALLLQTSIPGRLRIYDSLGNISLAESNPASDLAINNNDTITLAMSYNKGTVTATATNLRTLSSTTATYTFPLTYPYLIAQPINSYPALFAVGGTQYVYNWTYGSNALIGADYLFVGDSITKGLFADLEANRFSTLASAGKTYNTYAGAGLKINTIATPDIIRLAPKKMIVCMGTNDQIEGIGVSTSMDRLQTFKTNMEAAIPGVQIIFCKIPPLDSTDVTGYNTALVSTFGAAVKIDFFTQLKGAGTAYAVGKSPDGIHPAASEQAGMASLVVNNA